MFICSFTALLHASVGLMGEENRRAFAEGLDFMSQLERKDDLGAEKFVGFYVVYGILDAL